MKLGVFAAIPAVVAGGAVFAIWRLTDDPVERTLDIVQSAWESSYSERNLPVPPSGPRDGYWSAKVSPKPKHPVTGWAEPPYNEPGILEIDRNGMQFFMPTKSKPEFKILIVGGSVASGTYASGVDTTYFHQLGSMLDAKGVGCQIVVYAAGAWKSVQDVAAFKHFVDSIGKPDLVVFLNGLNDLTNGANADVLYDVPVKTKDGSPWTAEYHEHDYDARVDKYLKNMTSAAEFAGENEIGMLVALQPALFEKTPLAAIEQKLLLGSLVFHKDDSAEELAKSYQTIRSGLSDLVDQGSVSFVDCSRIFDSDAKTMYTDLWHFADVGHQRLAEVLEPKIREILSQ